MWCRCACASRCGRRRPPDQPQPPRRLFMAADQSAGRGPIRFGLVAEAIALPRAVRVLPDLFRSSDEVKDWLRRV